MTWQQLNVETFGEAQSSCACCESTTHRVWGWISDHSKTVAAYFVTYTLGRPDHGARYRLIVGRWGEGTSVNDRFVVELDYRMVASGPAFMVVDASPVAEVAARNLMRSDVIGTGLADQIFPMVDAVLMNDPRLEEIRQWSHPAR